MEEPSQELVLSLLAARAKLSETGNQVFHPRTTVEDRCYLSFVTHAGQQRHAGGQQMKTIHYRSYQKKKNAVIISHFHLIWPPVHCPTETLSMMLGTQKMLNKRQLFLEAAVLPPGSSSHHPHNPLFIIVCPALIINYDLAIVPSCLGTFLQGFLCYLFKIEFYP